MKTERWLSFLRLWFASSLRVLFCLSWLLSLCVSLSFLLNDILLVVLYTDTHCDLKLVTRRGFSIQSRTNNLDPLPANGQQDQEKYKIFNQSHQAYESLPHNALSPIFRAPKFPRLLLPPLPQSIPRLRPRSNSNPQHLHKSPSHIHWHRLYLDRHRDSDRDCHNSRRLGPNGRYPCGGTHHCFAVGVEDRRPRNVRDRLRAVFT